MVRNLSLSHSSVLKARRITWPSEIYEKETVDDERYCILEILLSSTMHTKMSCKILIIRRVIRVSKTCINSKRYL